MSEPVRILSLGAGVQSSVVLLMSCKGILPKLDHAIFADTQAEPKNVYAHLAWLEGEAKDAGIPVHRVTAGNLAHDCTEGRITKTGHRHVVLVPLFIRGVDQTLGVSAERHCTWEYKAVPVERKIRQLLGLRRGQRWPTHHAVDQWFGISADEAGRVRTPKRTAIQYEYPLVYELGLTRTDCEKWAAHHYPGRTFPRSACVFCPWHQNDEWRRVREDAEAWSLAVDIDKKLRHPHRSGGSELRGTGYLHHSGVPLEDADLTVNDKPTEHPRLFRHECMGMCGV